MEDKKVPDGWYEVIFFLITLGASNNGSEFIDFNLLVRDDVSQPVQGQHIHLPLWRSKKTNKYSRYRLIQMAKSCNLPVKNYRSLDEVMQAFQGRIARVKLVNEAHKVNGSIYEEISAVRWSHSEIERKLSDGSN